MSFAKYIAVAALSGWAAFANAYGYDQAKVDEAMQEHNARVAEIAKETNRPVPKTVDYKYGMDMDMAKTIRLSRDVEACAVVPQLMTYEDSKGQLRTVKYMKYGKCRNER